MRDAANLDARAIVLEALLQAALDRAVTAALNVAPDRRPASCDVWMDALHRALDPTAAPAVARSVAGMR